jgi:type IV pilus assembly protein PilC
MDENNIGQKILSKVRQNFDAPRSEVIYGHYNNAGVGIGVKINDFLIDHSKVTLRDKVNFFHMLAVMVDSGIPVVQALNSLSKRSRNLKFQRVLNTVAFNCEGGSNLANAMSRFDDIFDESELGVVRSGEATGRLNVMLFKLSEQLEKRNQLVTKLWGAAFYPIVVLIVLVLVVVGMLLWVFPTLLNLLSEGGVGGDSLPLPTRMLIGLQGALVNYWWLMILVVFAISGMFSFYKSTAYGKIKWDYIKLKMPVIGSLMRRVAVLRFISLLGILIDSGLPVLQSLQIVGNSISNSVYKIKIQETVASVKDGGKISKSLQDVPLLFDPEIVEMLAVGEASASIGPVAEKISEQYDREIDTSIKRLTAVFEPAMILFVGLFVALLALAVMAPIFNLSSTLTN